MVSCTMTPVDIERSAMHNDTLPVGLTQPEQFLYMSFRCLYSSYRAGTITREQAQSEKHELLSEYDKAIRLHEIFKDTCQAQVKLGGLSKEVEQGDCERCKKIMRILDGRERL
ncbi:MAG: hypothetical protein E7L17_10830 [Clostridium sp.]|nr:hypothetical protein [Clostridium sp.]